MMYSKTSLIKSLEKENFVNACSSKLDFQIYVRIGRRTKKVLEKNSFVASRRLEGASVSK